MNDAITMEGQTETGVGPDGDNEGKDLEGGNAERPAQTTISDFSRAPETVDNPGPAHLVEGIEHKESNVVETVAVEPVGEPGFTSEPVSGLAISTTPESIEDGALGVDAAAPPDPSNRAINASVNTSAETPGRLGTETTDLSGGDAATKSTDDQTPTSNPSPEPTPAVSLPTIILITIGSRGDVQPFIALALALQHAKTFRPVLASHAAHANFASDYGIPFLPLSGSPHRLMQLLSRGLLHLPAAAPHLLAFLTDLFDSTLAAAKACDPRPVAIVCSPALLISTHLADALNLPLFHLFFMPWHRTRVVPHPFLVPVRDLGASYNLASHVAAEEGLQFGARKLVSAFRRKAGLPTNSDYVKSLRAGAGAGTGTVPSSVLNVGRTWRYPAGAVPTIYGWTKGLLEKPSEWGEEIEIWWVFFGEGNDGTNVQGLILSPQPTHSGAFSLPPPTTPATSSSTESLPQSLLSFLEPPATPESPIIYVGFGSIVPPDPAALVDAVVQAVTTASSASSHSWRVVLARGWAHTPTNAPRGTYPPPPPDPFTSLPPNFYALDAIPHSALFPHLSAALHHGGSGTLSSCLLASLPSAIIPFFGDQYLWARLAEERGVGVWVRRVDANGIKEALEKCVLDRGMRERCGDVGNLMRTEGGATRAAEWVVENMERARVATVERRRAVGLDGIGEVGTGKGEITEIGTELPSSPPRPQPPAEDLDRLACELLEAMDSDLERPATSSAATDARSSPSLDLAPASNDVDEEQQPGLPRTPPSSSLVGRLLAKLLLRAPTPQQELQQQESANFDLAASLDSLPESLANDAGSNIDEGSLISPRPRSSSASSGEAGEEMGGSWFVVDEGA